MTINLTEDQQKHYNGVIQLCCSIEKEMNNTVDPADPMQVQNQLSNLLPYLSNLSGMVSTATAIYDFAKGEAADLAMANPTVLGLKSDVQKKWFDGKLAKFSALYARTEAISKNLRTSCEGLRSLLSYNKELINNHGG